MTDIVEAARSALGVIGYSGEWSTAWRPDRKLSHGGEYVVEAAPVKTIARFGPYKDNYEDARFVASAPSLINRLCNELDKLRNLQRAVLDADIDRIIDCLSETNFSANAQQLQRIALYR